MTDKYAIGVAISDNHLTLVRLAKHRQGGYCTKAYRHEPIQSFDDVEAILPRLVKAMKGSEDIFSLSIANQSYDLQLIDLPDVPEAEMADALPFKVRDFVSSDVEKLAMDWIPLPEEAWRGRRHMGFVVTMNKALIHNAERRFFKSGFKLKQVQVLQTAICQATSAAVQAGSVAVLLDWEGRAELIIHTQGQLILHRFIDVAIDEANQLGDTLAQHSLALEIQRSFDFLDSQMALGRPVSLQILRDEPVLDELLDQLQLDLGVPSDNLSLDNFVEQLPQAHSPCAFATAVGAAMSAFEVKR